MEVSIEDDWFWVSSEEFPQEKVKPIINKTGIINFIKYKRGTKILVINQMAHKIFKY